MLNAHAHQTNARAISDAGNICAAKDWLSHQQMRCRSPSLLTEGPKTSRNLGAFQSGYLAAAIGAISDTSRNATVFRAGRGVISGAGGKP